MQSQWNLQGAASHVGWLEHGVPGSEEGVELQAAGPVELCAPGRSLDFIPKSVGSLRDKLSPTDVSTKGGGQQSKRFSRPYLLEMHAKSLFLKLSDAWGVR